MLLEFDRFYYKFGLVRSTYFILPKVLDMNTIVLPYYSILHFYNMENEIYPTKNYLFLKYVKNMFIYNPIKYTRKIYDVREINLIENKLVKEMNKKYKDIPILTTSRFEQYIKNKVTRLKTDIPILNYIHIHDKYKYKNTIFDFYHMYVNGTITFLDNVVELNRKIMSNKNSKKVNHFLFINIPDSLYSLAIFNKFIKMGNVDKTMLKYFYNNDYLFLMDLFKLFDKDKYKESILYEYTKDLDVCKRINFIFVNKDKGIIINFYTLLSYIKTFDIKNNVKYDSEKFKHMFFIMLKTFLALPGFTPENIDDNEYMDKALKELGIEDDPNVEKALIAGLKDVDIDVDIIKKIESKIEEETDTTIDLTKNIKDEDIVVKSITDYKYKYSYKDLDTILKDKPSILENVKIELEELYKNDKIDSKRYKRLMDVINSNINLKSPYGGNEKIKDLLNIKKEELEIKDEDKKLPIPKVLYNKEDAKDTISARYRKYLKHVYKKDMIRTFMSIQKSGLLVKDIERNVHKDILGEYEEYTIQLTDLGKSTYKIKIKLPVIKENGTYKISGNEYVLRNQRIEIPIRKINYNRVALTTAYGKLFVDKAPMKKYDRGYSIRKELLKLSENGTIVNLVSGTQKLIDIKVPQIYSEISRYVKTFIYDGITFNFNYKNRLELIEGSKYKIEDIEKGGYILIGKDRVNKYYLIKDDKIYRFDNGKYIELDSVLDFFGINNDKIKTEYSMVRIFSTYIPVAVLLSYYMGLYNMLNSFNVKYEVLEGGLARVPKGDNIVVRFKFNTLVIYPKKNLDYMVLEGLTHYKKVFRNIDIDFLNNKETFKSVFNELDFKLNIVTEIDTLEQLFVDPVAETILMELNEPTTFIGLLIRSSELLLTDYFERPNSLKGFIIRNYERVSQYVYKSIVDSIKVKRNEEFFGKSRLTLDPYKTWRIINEDSASVLVNDLNPIMNLKQTEDVTYLGAGGRNKDALAKSTREFDIDDIGVMSESSKDTSDVGITAYLSSNPVIKDLRGLKDFDAKLSYSNILSTSAMITPYSIKDDPKRVVYTNVMNSHVLPLNKHKTLPVRTGAEALIPYRAGRKYIGYAEADGTVEKVTKDTIVVKYKDKKEKYKYHTWTSKEESGTTYKHILVPNVKEKQKVKYGDILYYDKGFFEPDMFDKTKVIYRANTIARIMWEEIPATYEDAFKISRKFSEDTSITIVKIRDLILSKEDEILNVVNIGDKLEPTTPLFTINTNIVSDSNLDEDTLDILQSFIKKSPKTKYKGKLIKIKVYYNFDKEEATKSIQELIDKTEKYHIDEETGEQFSGKVNSSYSVEGKPLDVGKLHINFYIEKDSGLSIGDKCVIGAQLKSTITTVNDKTILTEDGREVDAEFSYKGNMARIIRSIDYIGTTTTVLELIGEKACEIYFGK